MHIMKKRIISLLLAALLLLAAVPAMAAADPDAAGLDVVILIDRSGTMRSTDPSSIALAATKMFADRCNSRNNSVAVVTYGYDILTETDFYDLSSNGKVDQLRAEVDGCTIQDGSEDTNTGMALEYVYNKIAARRASFPNHQFAVLVISDGKIDIGDSQAFKADDNYPDKGEATQSMLIQQSQSVGAATAQTCASEGIPIYCLGIYSQKSNLLGDDMSNWSDVTGGMYRDTNDINDVYNIIREMYLDMTGNPDSIPVTDGMFSIPDNALEANVEIVPSVAVGRMTLSRPDGTQVDLSGADPDVKIREDSQYTMVKLTRPQSGDWTLSFSDGVSRALTVYVTCNLDLSMQLIVPETSYNQTPVTLQLSATKQKTPYYDPAQPAELTVTSDQTGAVVAQGNMTWNAAEGLYEYSFTPTDQGSYSIHAQITTDEMTNVATARLNVTPRPVTLAQTLGDYAFSGHLLSAYAPYEQVADLRLYFNDPDHRGIVGYEVELSEYDFISAVADNATGKLTYTALKATVNPITVTVYAIDGLNERSEPLTGTVTVLDGQHAITLSLDNPAPTGTIKLRGMLPEKQGKTVLTALSSYFREPNEIDGEFIASITAVETSSDPAVEVSVVNDELVLRGLKAGSGSVTVTALSSDGSTAEFIIPVQVISLTTTILLICLVTLLVLALIALAIYLVVQANKPAYRSMASLTVTLYGDDEFSGTDMLRKYGKRKVKLSEVCRKAAMHTGSFGAYLDQITVTPRKNGVQIQCAIKGQPPKQFTLRPYDGRTIDVDPVNAYSIKLEYYEA